MSSTFFDLCPDILIEIFTYFSLNELFDTFIDLIPYLSRLINQSHMNLHIDRNSSEQFWNRFLPEINSNQIMSLSNSNLRTNLEQFSFLRSAKLSLQSSDLFQQFHYLIHLEQLSLELSKVIFEDHIWLFQILSLPNLKILKLDLMISKNTLQIQDDIFIEKLTLQSNTIKYLELKIPMSCESLVSFLEHFPNLQIFRASLYRLNSFMSQPYTSTSFHSLQTLDLQGYFNTMSSTITFISSTMPNLKRCRLISVNVTNDNVYNIQNCLIWKNLFKSCLHLIELKVHLLMSIEENNNFNGRALKELIRTFNDNPFCEKYNFQMEQRSINRGYVTLTADYNRKKIKH